MLTSLLLSALLAATGQATGRPVEADLSNRTVKATGSTTPRALKDRFADDVHVADFGLNATGNSGAAAANDTAIALAIALAGTTSGKRLIFPAGFIYISDTIDDTAGLNVIRGSGSAATIIVWKAGTSGTGKALLRLRGRTTRVEGMNLNGSASGVPDVGIDFYPTISLIAQMHRIEDVWVGTSTPPAVGLWSHDPLGGQQHEMITIDRSRINGLNVGVKLDKPHDDLWTFRDCYIGHTDAAGVSFKTETGSTGMGLRFEHSWLIGPNKGMQFLGQWEDMTWIASGSESGAPATAIDASMLLRWRMEGQNVGGTIVVPVNKTLRVSTSHTRWFVSPTRHPFAIEGQVIWESDQDYLYNNDGLSIAVTPDDLAMFVSSVATGGGNLAFSLAHEEYGTIAHPIRVGGAHSIAYYPPGTPTIEAQPTMPNSPSVRFKSSDGTTRFQVDETGAYVQGVSTVTGSQAITGDLTVGGAIAGLSLNPLLAKSDGSELDTLTVTNLAWPSNPVVYGGNWSRFSTAVVFTPSATIGPDGINKTGALWALSAGNNSFGLSQPGQTLSGNYTWSMYAKAGTYHYVSLDFTNAYNVGATFDASNCTSTFQQGGVTTAVRDIGGGWCRFSISKSLASSTYYPRVFLPAGSGNETTGWVAAGTETIYLSGAQLTASAVPLVYIPTSTGSVAQRVYHLP